MGPRLLKAQSAKDEGARSLCAAQASIGAVTRSPRAPPTRPRVKQIFRCRRRAVIVLPVMGRFGCGLAAKSRYPCA